MILQPRMDGDDPVYSVKMGYAFHMRPTENLLAGIHYLRGCLPREKYFDFEVSDAERSEKLSYLDSFSRALPKTGLFRPNNDITLKVRGEVDPEWKKKAGFMIANMLADASFNYSLVLPGPEARFKLLKKVMT